MAPPSVGGEIEPNPQQRFLLSGSHAVFTLAQLTDLNSTPDWYPSSHSAMPDIVAARGPAHTCRPIS
jgi:hypothetical protein